MADEIIKKLEEHDKRFDKLDQQLGSVTKKAGEHDKQLETIALTVVDNKERLDHIEENMATKGDTNKIMSTLDELVGLAKKKDEELTSMSENVKYNTSDIEKIKPLVGLEVS